MLDIVHEDIFRTVLTEVKNNSRFKESRQYMQHGSTSIYSHSVYVAYLSCKIAEKCHLKVSYPELIRGALLHDYFLYDWHDGDNGHKKPHGFHHANAALANAVNDFSLTDIEKNIIKRHMFPLTPVPPACLEAWVVCLADKLCSTRESIIR